MVSERLKKVILEELDLTDYELQPSTTADTVPGWDSLSHARIIAAVEREFDVEFAVMDLLRLKNVGDLQALVDRKSRA